MDKKVCRVVYELLGQFLPVKGLVKRNEKIALEGSALTITLEELIAPVNLKKRLAQRLSPLPDNFVQTAQLKAFVSDLKRQNLITSFNHIGFCYQAEDPAGERNAILEELENSGFDLYEEKSADESLWLFIGTKNWEEPMIELLPIGEIADPWLNQWLPHIHLDFDTKAEAEELDRLAVRHFGGNPVPFHAVITESYIHTVRLRLGITGGVNITLDLATKRRSQAWRRQHLLKKLSAGN